MIQDFHNTHDGVALIIGNGPSLDKVPLADFGEKYISFGSNKIYDFPFKPTYWTCTDGNMLHTCIPWIMEHPEFDPPKFVPRNVPLPGAHQFNPVVEIGFSQDAAVQVFMGGTVSYINMQLAWYMGFRNLILLGMDHRYSKTEKGGKPGSAFIAAGEDPDHFRGQAGAYFLPGHIYNRPELAATERYFFPLAKKAFEKVVNLTPNSAIMTFETGDWKKYI